jgi:uncharacterized protein (DUF1330 family)
MKMAAYVIAEIQVTDPTGYEEYRGTVGASIEQYGGKFLVRAGKVEVLEGDWQPGRLVVIEFASADRARAWWSSEPYREPKAIRERTATTKLIVVEGV